MKLILISVAVVVVLILIWALYGYFAVRNIERPSYSVIEKRDGYEIRTYDQYVVAETTVSGNMQQAMNEGFTRIAGYIFGGNTTKASISMTAPVSEKIEMTVPVSEKIAMTAPVVAGDETNGARVISFVMPSKYTLETLPVPDDARVKLRAVAGHTVAALSFSWSSSAETVTAKKLQLASLLARDRVTVAGEPQAAFYNPPWTPPFMLHSEILIPISE